MDIRQQLIGILNALNLIDVKGRDNMDRLLGSIIALENVLNYIIEQNKKEEGAKE